MSNDEQQRKSVLEQAQARLRGADPERVAALSGAEVDVAHPPRVCPGTHSRGRLLRQAQDKLCHTGQSVLTLRLLDQTLQLTHPRLEVARADGQPCPQWQAHLLTYYLSMADGTNPAGTWVALRDLPDGMFYQTAYQGYSGGNLVRAFGNDVEAFRAACRALGGETLNTGDAGYRFLVLPRVWLAAIYWLGEDAIPPSARVLFDAAIKHYLPTDSCAALGGWLSNRIIEQHRGS